MTHYFSIASDFVLFFCSILQQISYSRHNDHEARFTGSSSRGGLGISFEIGTARTEISNSKAGEDDRRGVEMMFEIGTARTEISYFNDGKS